MTGHERILVVGLLLLLHLLILLLLLLLLDQRRALVHWLLLGLRRPLEALELEWLLANWSGLVAGDIVYVGLRLHHLERAGFLHGLSVSVVLWRRGH